MPAACAAARPCHLENSDFLKIDRRNTIHPQEMESVGRAARKSAFSGGMDVKLIGAKKSTNTITIMTSRLILSFFVLGGVKNIFFKSISTAFFSCFTISFISCSIHGGSAFPPGLL